MKQLRGLLINFLRNNDQSCEQGRKMTAFEFGWTHPTIWGPWVATHQLLSAFWSVLDFCKNLSLLQREASLKKDNSYIFAWCFFHYQRQEKNKSEWKWLVSHQMGICETRHWPCRGKDRSSGGRGFMWPHYLSEILLLCVAIKIFSLFNQQAKTKTKLCLFDQSVLIFNFLFQATDSNSDHRVNYETRSEMKNKDHKHKEVWKWLGAS